MASYRVLKRCYLQPTKGHPRVYDRGDLIEIDGPPNSCLAPLDAAAELACEQAKAGWRPRDRLIWEAETA